MLKIEKIKFAKNKNYTKAKKFIIFASIFFTLLMLSGLSYEFYQNEVRTKKVITEKPTATDYMNTSGRQNEQTQTDQNQQKPTVTQNNNVSASASTNNKSKKQLTEEELNQMAKESSDAVNASDKSINNLLVKD